MLPSVAIENGSASRRTERIEAWHLIVRRYDQRNTSDRSSAYAALISKITERDRAKDVEHFDDILRTFKNEMTKLRTDSVRSGMRRMCSRSRN